MRKPRTAAEMGDLHVEQAARARPPQAPALARDITLSLPRPAVRDLPGPEPVAADWVNGRPPGGRETGWPFCELPPVSGAHEEEAIRDARLRERRAEAVLLAGTGGPP